MGIAVLVVTVLAGAGIAAVAAVDFTGRWTGTATEKGQSPSTLIADLTSAERRVPPTVIGGPRR